MQTNALFNSFVSAIRAMDTMPILGSTSGRLLGYAVFFKKAGQENILFLENTTRQTTTLTAQAPKYPTELGFNQTEFKFKDPTTIKITGIISRKGTGLAGANFSISSLALKNPLQSKSSLIKGTLKDIDYLIANNVLCEVWALNGGKRSYMTMTGASMPDDLMHNGLFEVDLSFVEVQSLILDPEPILGAFASKINSGVCQIVSKVV